MKADGENLGKWANKHCDRYFGVVCEKTQDWSLDQMKKFILELRKENKKMKQILRSTTYELTKVKQNPVPIGFIYVQLHQQPAPTDMWPNTIWNETSDQYSGLFFRVSGGKSATFGIVQEEFSPRIVFAETWLGYGTCENDKERYRHDKTKLIDRAATGPGIVTRFTDQIETAVWNRTWNDRYCNKQLRFESMNGEVRPRNTAVKIWKRTA